MSDPTTPAPPPLRRRPLSPLDGPRPPRLRRARATAAPPDDSPAAGVWTEAKVAAVLGAFRSMVSNAATKHGIPAAEVMALLRDHILDPGD